ncbi:hypothetical protein LGK95_03410 [Clostridium algoriphilum]|uniref:ATP cone domain-containing protein n=1 Tax=Clostridium algoriphilum TaxID=198347 RepID=UPI001CF24B21|nr:ATP cone domain-containing protein [Clostridium algoriphilum]MCB2292588.1 hypothetical protein [Clostridium algoriphilum]
MKVIKRDGRLQDFNLSKIKTSISRASDDAGQPLNIADIDNLAEDIWDSIEKYQKDPIAFNIIHEIVLGELEKWGFSLVAKYYNQGKLE